MPMLRTLIFVEATLQYHYPLLETDDDGDIFFMLHEREFDDYISSAATAARRYLSHPF